MDSHAAHRVRTHECRPVIQDENSWDKIPLDIKEERWHGNYYSEWLAPVKDPFRVGFCEEDGRI